MVGKVEKIRPQFINKERGDADENISAKDTYMRVYSFSIEERERERERKRERERERERESVFIDVIYSTRTTITTLLQRLRPIVL